MKKVIKLIDDKRGIWQITTYDERWYVKETIDPVTGLPVHEAVPSVTWIGSYYPKGIGYYRWLSEHGWDEAEAIKREAGDKGSKVHDAISSILRGEEVRIDSKFTNKTTGELEELTFPEIDCIKAFVDWRELTKPVDLLWDHTVFSSRNNFAGSIDYICKMPMRFT
jgi:hypothetical protein